jgi:hypothetical protein
VIALGQHINQKYGGQPAHTQALMVTVCGVMLVDNLLHSHLLHYFQDQGNTVHPLDLDYYWWRWGNDYRKRGRQGLTREYEGANSGHHQWCFWGYQRCGIVAGHHYAMASRLSISLFCYIFAFLSGYWQIQVLPKIFSEPQVLSHLLSFYKMSF